MILLKGKNILYREFLSKKPFPKEKGLSQKFNAMSGL